MKRIHRSLSLALLLSLAAICPRQATAVMPPPDVPIVPPEKTTAVNLSNTDVNRIICPSAVTHLAFSEEKGMNVERSGDNLFVKFSYKSDGSRTVYATAPNELFIVTDTDVYNLIIYPSKIPSQTVWLEASRTSRAREALDRYAGMPEEAKMIDLIMMARKGTVTESTLVKKSNTEVMSLYDKPAQGAPGVKQMRIEGQGLNVKIFNVHNGLDMPIQLHEKQFLKPAISSHPRSVALDALYLEPDETGRLFVVENVDVEQN